MGVLNKVVREYPGKAIAHVFLDLSNHTYFSLGYGVKISLGRPVVGMPNTLISISKIFRSDESRSSPISSIFYLFFLYILEF